MAEPFSMAPDFSWVDEGADPVQAAAEAAAARTRNAVRSHYGRPEGKATAVLDSLGTSLYNTAAKPARIWGALGEVPPGQPLSERPDIVDAVAQVSTDLLGAPALMPGGIVKGAAGIFGGRLAQTADHAKLARAEAMAAQGATPSMIRDVTGWHQGVDGKWRFEIPDNAATVKNFQADAPFGPLSMHVDHPELYAAYPDLAEIGAKLEMRSSPKEGAGFGSFTPDQGGSRTETIRAYGQTPEEARSVALHEMQHAVQTREGFARGGSPEGFKKDVGEANSGIEFINEHLSNLSKQMDAARKAGDSAKVAELKGFYDKTMNYKLTDLVPRALVDPVDSYKRLAGEVEARNVQKRADWDVQRRADVPPVYSQDVPNADQIVRHRDVPMSMAPDAKLSREAISEFSDQLKQKHGLSHLSIYPTNAGDLNLSVIEVPREARKQGIGTAALRDIVDYADQSGMRLTLTPGLKDSRHGTTSRGRLVDFYKQFGFVENKGRNKDFTISEGMYRPAKRGN